MCAIDYPAAEGMFAPSCSKCVVCGGPTSRFYAEPYDPEWETKASQLLELRKDDELVELVPEVKGRVRVESEQLWVLSWDVHDTFRRRLGWGELFRIGKQTFEVLSYVDEQRAYLVRPFSMTLTDEYLARLVGP